MQFLSNVFSSQNLFIQPKLNPDYKEKITIYTENSEKILIEPHFCDCVSRILQELSARFNTNFTTICISMQGLSELISKQILKIMNSNDSLLSIHVVLRLKKISHEFFIFSQFISESPLILNISDPNSPKISDFIKLKLQKLPFYLENDRILYIRTKNADAENYKKLELVRTTNISLENLEENKGVIILQREAEILRFKVTGEENCKKVFNELNYGVKSAKLNEEINLFEKHIENIETQISQYEEMKILEKSFGIPGLLNFENSCKLLFSELEHNNPVSIQIHKLYELLQKFSKFDKKYTENSQLAENMFKNLCEIYEFIQKYIVYKESHENIGKNTEKDYEIYEKLKAEFLEKNIRKTMLKLISKEDLIFIDNFLKSTDKSIPFDKINEIIDRLIKNILEFIAKNRQKSKSSSSETHYENIITNMLEKWDFNKLFINNKF